MMTQLSNVELAKQGNANAIARLITRSLKAKGIIARASLKDQCLRVMLESTQVPSQPAMVQFIRKSLMKLNAESIKTVKIYGKQIGQNVLAWSQEFDWDSLTLTGLQKRPQAQLARTDWLGRANPFQLEKYPSFLQAILEGLFDGILILTEQGEWVHANDDARRICRQLAHTIPQHRSVPRPIWHVCASLIDSRQLFPEQKMIIESQIHLSNSTIFRIRVQWVELEESDKSYLLVTLEDQYLSTQNAALNEAKKHGLTPRETQIWLLRRTHCSYQEIANKLYITLNTVKKHMKNIYKKLGKVAEETIAIPNEM